MNYKKIYEDFMLSRQNMNRKKLKKDHPNYIYYENHHIIPRCLHGTDEKQNLVLLTAKEHFIAHMLLAEVNKDSKRNYIRMVIALHKMTHIGTTKRIFSHKENMRKVRSGKTYEEIYGFEKALEIKRKKCHKQIKPKQKNKIYQFDLSMNLIKIWPSIADARLGMNSKGAALGECARGLCKTSIGFIWKYEKDIINGVSSC